MYFHAWKKEEDLFRIERLGDGIVRIRDIMDVGMYLIEGDKRAALIDTGFGIGDVSSILRMLTDKPIEVYLTHGHVDHGGGIYAFHKVYVPKEDIDLLKWHSKPEIRLGFAATYDSELCLVEDILMHMPFGEIEIETIEPGIQIDLGGRNLTVVNLQGHTRGSVGFFDHKTKTLFAGDGCNNSTFLFLRESTSVTEYRDTLKILKKEWQERIERILICHGDIQNIPLMVIDDLIECCNLVLEGKGSRKKFVMPYKPFQNGVALWAEKGEASRSITDGHFGNLIYCTDKI